MNPKINNHFKIKAMSFCLLLFCNLTLIAQQVQTTDTLTIKGETKSIFIPPKNAPTKEVAQIEEALKQELNSYVLEMQNQKFISDNVIAEVKLDVIDEDGIPALKAVYSYSLKNDTLKYKTDDFTLGNYRISGSNAVMVTLALMRSSVEGRLNKYITPGKEISININGSADATPIRGEIPYKGEFGQQVTANCEANGNNTLMTVTTTNGITDNPTLAFLRSYAVRNYIETNVEGLKQTTNTFKHIAAVSGETGGKYRRVSIEMVVHNAFENVKPD